MEDCKTLQAKLDLLEKKIKELDGVMPQEKSLHFPTFPILLSLIIILGGVVCCSIFAASIECAIACSSLVIIVLAIGLFAYRLIALIKSERRHIYEIEMSIYKEREMSVINLRKSLVGKVLDSITFDNKKDCGAEKEKKDDSDNTKLKEQYDHEERMAIINALGNNCSKESISEILKGIKDIQKLLKGNS